LEKSFLLKNIQLNFNWYNFYLTSSYNKENTLYNKLVKNIFNFNFINKYICTYIKLFIYNYILFYNLKLITIQYIYNKLNKVLYYCLKNKYKINKNHIKLISLRKELNNNIYDKKIKFNYLIY